MLDTAPALPALLAAYDALPEGERAGYLWGLDLAQAEQLACALARRALGRPVELLAQAAAYDPTPVSGGPPALTPRDDEAAALLLAAVVEVADRDARRGDRVAAQWLAELRACRPARVRLMATDDPRPLPGRWGRAVAAG